MAGESDLIMNYRLCIDNPTTIKVRRLEWTGHLVRTSDDRTIKKVFLEKRDGRRQAARPKLRWLDCIENDLS
jgi:hypothetical protein